MTLCIKYTCFIEFTRVVLHKKKNEYLEIK